jgi:succinoglycan biosynthesis protein ExoM
MISRVSKNDAVQAAKVFVPVDDLVSVIVPVYQGERIVLGAVRSALNQTHRHLEVIVVDDGSTDATQAALSTVVDERVQVLRQPNSGTAAARNLALSRARGRYVAFLDCDDRWFPEKIATELSLLRERADAIGIAYSSYYAVDDRGRLLNGAPIHGYDGSALDVLLDGEDFLMPSVCLFDRRIFDAIGNFSERHFHEDYEFILRATRYFPIFPTKQRLVVYRQSTSGKCRGILADFEAARDEELRVLSDIEDLLSPAQRARLQQNIVRSLYCRFLMYGFGRHAKRLLGQVDTAALRKGKKGWLAWISAKSGINLLAPARQSVQLARLAFGQSSWRKRLVQSCLELGYEEQAPPVRAGGPEGRATRVCVAIPTFRRPDLLKALLRGVAAQKVPNGISVEVLVIDNDREPSARPVVAEMLEGFPFELRYEHVATPGLSAVRNFALSYSRFGFDFLAMIDDDEYPRTEWLSELLRIQQVTRADAVIGPVPKSISPDAPKWIRAGHFYELPSYRDGALIKHGHSGNCLLSVSSVERSGVTFDGELNLAGGEDMLFFQELLAGGARLAYARRAVAFETIGPERLKAAYILKLYFRRGNTLTFCDRRLKGTAGSVLVRAVKGYGRIVLGVVLLLPLTLARGRAGGMSALCNVAHGLGSLSGLTGHVYHAYKR